MKSEAPQRRLIILLLLVCAAALAVRLTVAFASPNIVHPDQIFQMLEQSYRLVYGYGIVPWEFREGVRSWILPGLFALIFKIADLLFSVPGANLIAATIFLSLLSLSPVVCGFLWAYQLLGERAAVITAGFTAVWFELVYFATASLSEVCAVHVLLAGLFLAFPGTPVLSNMRLGVAGSLLGLALMLRIQLLPALAVVALYAYWVRRRQPWRLLALGFAIPVIGAGLLDWAAWGYPWQSLWKYAYLSLQRSSNFALPPWYYYFVEFVVFWNVALLPMLGLIWLGARRLPLLGAMAAAILIAHSLVAHKEYRYIYPAIAMLIILAGLGFSEVAAWFRLDSWTGAAACLLIVTCASAFLAVQNHYRDYWTASAGEIRAFRAIAGDPQACGILLWRQRGWTTPGYAGLHRNLPMYEVVSQRRFSQLESAANYVVTRTPIEDPGGYVLTNSFNGASKTYLYRRAGRCSDEHLPERLAYPDWFGEREPTDE